MPTTKICGEAVLHSWRFVILVVKEVPMVWKRLSGKPD
jgi:hypothetical protein